MPGSSTVGTVITRTCSVPLSATSIRTPSSGAQQSCLPSLEVRLPCALQKAMPFLWPFTSSLQMPPTPRAARGCKGPSHGSCPRGTSMSKAPGSPTSIHHLLPKSTAEPPDSRESRACFHLTALSKQLSSSRAASSTFLRQGGYAAADPSNPTGKIGPDFQSLAVNQGGLQARSQSCIQVLLTQAGDTHRAGSRALLSQKAICEHRPGDTRGGGGFSHKGPCSKQRDGQVERTEMMLFAF